MADIKTRFHLRLNPHRKPSVVFLFEAEVGLIPHRGESLDLSPYIADVAPLVPKDIKNRLREPVFVEHVHTVLKPGDESVAVTVEFYGDRSYKFGL